LSLQTVAAAATVWGRKQYHMPEDGEQEGELGPNKQDKMLLKKAASGHYLLGSHNWRDYKHDEQNSLVHHMVQAAYRE
jgi:hypothetical protein